MKTKQKNVTNEEFKSLLKQYRIFMKPALYTVLVENADAFSEKTKVDIIEKLEEANDQMRDLYDYQEKRNSIMRKGLHKIHEIYENAKAKFKKAGVAAKTSEMAEAEDLLTNL